MARHHYIPVFYLSKWATLADKRVCEFSRPRIAVVPKRVHPSGTAFLEGLYNVPGVPDHQNEFIEDKFLRLADQQANDAHQELLKGNLDLDVNTRIAWTRFIMSLMSRTPDRVAFVKKMYEEEFAQIIPNLNKYYDDLHAADPSKPSAKEKEADIKRAAASGVMKVMQNVMDLPNAGSHILNMPWSIITVRDPRYSLLTGDRPAYLSDGLQKETAVLTLPISPTKIFIAANNGPWLATLKNNPSIEFIKSSNNLVARNAIDFVYGEDDSQLQYVENRLRGKDEPVKGIVPRLPVDRPSILESSSRLRTFADHFGEG
jgi:hypothetical protein